MNKSQQTHSKHIINRRLHRLIDKIQDKYPNLNFGGCGAFAVLLGDILDKYHIEYDFVVDTPSFYKKDEYKQIFPNRITKYYLSNYYLTCRHTYIQIGRAKFNKMAFSYHPVIIDSKLKHLFKNNIKESIGFGRHCWNDAFDIVDLCNIRRLLTTEFKNCIKD